MIDVERQFSDNNRLMGQERLQVRRATRPLIGQQECYFGLSLLHKNLLSILTARGDDLCKMWMKLLLLKRSIESRLHIFKLLAPTTAVLTNEALYLFRHFKSHQVKVAVLK